MDPDFELHPDVSAAPASRQTARPSPKPTAAVASFAFLLITAMWAAVWSFLHNQYAGDVEAQKRHNENLTRALEQATLRTLGAADQALRQAKQRIESRRKDPELGQILRETGLTPQTMQLVVYNREGGVDWASVDMERAKLKAVSDADREHFRAHAARDSGTLFFGSPILNRLDDRMAVPLSRRVNGPDGRFDGVVAVFIDRAYFAASYGDVQLGRDGVVLLAGLDGTVRAHSPGQEEFDPVNAVERRLPHLAEAASRADAGSYIANDGVQRIYSFRRLDGYPGVIAVATALPDALTRYKSSRRLYLALAAVFTAVVLVAAVSVALSLDRLLSMADALRSSEANARAANVMKSEFLAGMSHALRPPLASIRALSELLEKRLDQPALREQAGTIRRASDHVSAVLNDIFDVSQIEAGAVDIVPAPVDVHRLATELVDAFRADAQQRGLALALQIDVDVPHTAALDARRVRQALDHLLSNAIEFTGSGHVELHVGRHGEQLILTISHTGPAADGGPVDLAEWFQQAEPAAGGARLRLALSRSLAQLMGGDLIVESGSSSRLTLALPIRAEPPPPARARLPLAA